MTKAVIQTVYTSDKYIKSQKIFICIITPIFNEPSIIAQVNDLASLLSKSYNINLITGKMPKVNDNNIKIIEIPIYHAKRKNLINIIINFVKINIFILKYILKFENCTKIFLFYNTNYIPAMIMLKLKSRKIIFFPVGLISNCVKYWYQDNLMGLGKHIMPFLFNLSRSVSYALSDVIVIEYSMQLPRISKKIFVAPFRFADRFLAVDNPYDLGKLNHTIGYIGRFSEEKGVLNFVESISFILKNISNVNFMLMGGGELENRLKERIKKLGIDDKVEFSGWIEHNELNKWLIKLDLVIIPSYTEGLPGVLIESLACGIPVLATPVGAIPDYIIDRKTGFIMKDNSPKCIAENVIRALNDPKLQYVSRNGRLLAEKKFNRKTILKNWEHLINNIA